MYIGNEKSTVVKQILMIENWLMALSAAAIFCLSFRVNQLFDNYFVFAPGMSLLFLPAGVKLLFVLVGRWPAITGLLISGIYLGTGIWPEKELFSITLFAIVSLMTYPISAYVIMRWLDIHRDLTNLRYWHIVLMSLLASVSNGVIHNILYMAEDVTTVDDFWVKAAAMTFGDFMGCFVVVAIFQLIVSKLKNQNL
jgi:glucose-6-phosphate-specific signal transduction histidine kinase